MPSEPIRKLAAIMFTDIAGYTSLASEDEEKALKLINEQRSLLQIIVKEFNGTWLKEMGDGLLLSFPSSKLAVEAAIKIQQKTKEIGDLNLRIGIHQGDIIEQDGDIFGDDVNIASKIEAFSAIGGVAVTDKVMGDISSSPNYKLKFVNEPILKGIRQKIKVYCIISHGLPETILSKVSAKVEAIEEIAFGKRIKEDKPKKIIFIRTAVVIIAIPIIWIALNFIPDDDTGREVIADENSIAVLFIENIADPEDSLKLTQMIKELLITDLSQSKTLRVIGSQRLYDLAKKIGGQNGFQVNRDNASQIAREARVQWMLNGSLTQLGEKIILTTQIENVKDGKVLDAQRADGTKLFEIIDLISLEIREDLGVIASKNESDFPIEEITTDSPEAYKLYVYGLDAFWDNKFVESTLFFSQAVDIDSTFSQALLYLTVAQAWISDDSSYSEAKITVNKLMRNNKGLNQTQINLAKGAYAIIYNDLDMAISTSYNLIQDSPDSKWGYYLSAEAFYRNKEFVKTMEPLEHVLALDPEFKMAYIHLFEVYFIEGLYDKGINLADQFNQKFPNNSLGYYALGHFYNGKSENSLARSLYEKAFVINPDYLVGGINYLDFLISENDVDEAYYLLQKLEKSQSYSRYLNRVWLKYYEELLHLWQDSDREHPNQRAAQKRLAALKQGS